MAYVRNSIGSGAASTQTSSFGLEKVGQAVLSGLCLRIVRRILLCSTADIPIMAFSAANVVILGSHDPSLPDVVLWLKRLFALEGDPFWFNVAVLPTCGYWLDRVSFLFPSTIKTCFNLEF